jgi:6-phosphofructokinase
MIKSGRNKIETPKQFQDSLTVCETLGLDGLVVIGGDDSNTNACLLAEYFKKMNSNVKVIGCPKTIDGDLKNEFVEVSFGFDTACKTYSELIGNLMIE